MRVLVTGGCGFIGSHLVEHHLAKDDEVYVVDDLSTGSLQNVENFKNNPKFQFDQADIVTWPHFEKAINWADRIYHMAAVVGVYRVLNEPHKVISTNISGFDRLLNIAATCNTLKRIVLASSSSVYGHSNNPLLNENDSLILASTAHPLKIYAISKIADEALAMAYYKTAKLPITIVRLFNTIGPRQTGRYGMVVPRFVKQACSGEPITIFGNGTQTRSFCDVRDSICALDKLADIPDSIGNIINVGRDVEMTINDLASLVLKRANSHSEIQHIPYIEAYGEEFTDIRQRRPDLRKLYQLTGFKHEWTLEKTVDNLIAMSKGKE